MNNITRVNKELKRQNIKTNDVSPNLVNLIANELGINKLTSKQVIYISDNYRKD